MAADKCEATWWARTYRAPSWLFDTSISFGQHSNMLPEKQINMTTGPYAFSREVFQLYKDGHSIYYTNLLESIIDKGQEYKGSAVWVHECEGSWFGRNDSTIINLFISKRTGVMAMAILVLVGLFTIKLTCGTYVATRTALVLGFLIIITSIISIYYERWKCKQWGVIC